MNNLKLFYGSGNSYKIAMTKILENLERLDVNKKFNEIT